MSDDIRNLEEDMQQRDGLETNNSFEGLIVGKVIDNRDPLMEGRVKVFSPKLMPDKSYDEAPVKVNYTSRANNVINTNSFGNTTTELNEVNGLWARPTQLFESGDTNWNQKQSLNNSGSLRIPRIGSQVFLYYLDGDPNKCYYLPLSPTINGQKISSQFGSKNSNDPEKQCNIDIIRKYHNEMRIEADTNENENSLTATVVRQENGKATEKTNIIRICDNPNERQITIIQAMEHSVVINDNQIILTNSNGTSITVNPQSIDIIGDTNITGDLTVSGNGKFGGNVQIGGKLTTGGDAVIKGKSFIGHTHSGRHGITSPPN